MRFARARERGAGVWPRRPRRESAFREDEGGSPRVSEDLPPFGRPRSVRSLHRLAARGGGAGAAERGVARDGDDGGGRRPARGARLNGRPEFDAALTRAPLA